MDYKYCPVIGCIEGAVRLVDGRNPREGRVELCMNNMWGRVCNYYWSTNSAKVVCRELGYSPTGEYIDVGVI